MASNQSLPTLMAIAANLTESLSASERYAQLLSAVHKLFPCDSSALLKLEGHELRPVATLGLSPDTAGRRFIAEEHPRFSAILRCKHIVRFDSDCGLPDPYDGLLVGHEGDLSIHDCLGASLFIQGRLWGVLSLDSLEVGRFAKINDKTLQALISLTAATVAVVEWIEALEQKLDQQRRLNNAIVVEKSYSYQESIIGDSSVMQQLRKDIETVAGTNLITLITGESGTGKELVAREIHRQSQRADQALIYVNCAALPENLVESELFGHVKGAFSGALSQRSGKFELANNGSLFLDEIGELPIAVQAKLLRALQFGEVQRVGADRTIQMDVRIIAATNRDLKEEIKAGRFRADLYHRLCVYPIWVPCLRERENDVLALTGFFLEKARSHLGFQSLRISTSATRMIRKYSWPGNVRELEHTLSRAALRARQYQTGHAIVTISPQDLALEPENTIDCDESMYSENMDSTTSLNEATDNFQRQFIENKVLSCNNNWAEAARELDMNRSNLHRLAKRLGLK